MRPHARQRGVTVGRSNSLATRGATSPPAIPKSSFASSERLRRRMQSQRRQDTGPELALRRALHKRGLRYFVHRRPLPALRRTADIVFPTTRVAVFMDGCFWHGCPEHSQRLTRHNAWYWPEKIASNQRRDRDTDDRLRAEGWLSVRIWEHENPAHAATRILAIVRYRAGSRAQSSIG
jgi:DNA mismatch endonuclease, patch repair protein